MHKRCDSSNTSSEKRTIKPRNFVVTSLIRNPKRNAGKHYSKVTKFKGVKE
jgi:hypothetical protein